MKIMAEFSKNPLGSYLVDGTFAEWPEAIAVKDLRCSCGSPDYDFDAICTHLRNGVDGLPRSVDEIPDL